MSGQCIAVVSGKGGTGKTSLTAGVGEALALMGHRVLCIDCDAGLRNLDLALPTWPPAAAPWLTPPSPTRRSPASTC